MEPQTTKIINGVRYIRSARSLGSHPATFPIVGGEAVKWEDALPAVETFRQCFGLEHTIESLAAEGGFTTVEFEQLSKGINPLTGANMRESLPRHHPHVMCRAVILHLDGRMDSQRDIIEARGVLVADKVTVTRNFGWGTENVFGIGQVKVENKIELVCYFTLPSARIPDFPLWAGIDGELLEFEQNEEQNVRVIKRCKINRVGISTTPNQDPTIPPIQAVSTVHPGQGW